MKDLSSMVQFFPYAKVQESEIVNIRLIIMVFK